MKTRILGILAGIALLLSAASVYAGGPPPKPEQISLTYTFVDYTNYDPGTCDSSTDLPYAGDPACVEYTASVSNLTGDFVGTEFEEDTIVFFANGGYSYFGYEMWTGELEGRGTSTLVVLGDGIATPSGFATGKLRIVDGTGTGNLVGISGSGNYTGNSMTGIYPATMTVEFPGPPYHH